MYSDTVVLKHSIVARQHAMPAERDIALPIPSVRLSVRLSVCLMPVFCKRKHTASHF